MTPVEPGKPSRAGLFTALALLSGTALVCINAAWRATPPVEEMRLARDALAAARSLAVEQWAPEHLAEAERLLTAALSEYQAEQARVRIQRRYDFTLALLNQAMDRGRLAMRSTVERREEARRLAEVSLEDAADSVGRAEDVASVVALPPSALLSLSKARLALHQAESLMGFKEYTSAGEHGEKASRLASKAAGAASALASRFADKGSIRTWRSWVDHTLDRSRRSGAPAIVVNKDQGVVTLYVAGKPLRAYAADMGVNNAGRKSRAWDGATPEGTYEITQKKDIGASIYHKALLLNYPNEADKRRLAREVQAGRLPRGARPGSNIEIHGRGGQGRDWTEGCVALSDSDMDDLFRRVPVGTPVTIVGALGTGGKFSSLSSAGSSQP